MWKATILTLRFQWIGFRSKGTLVLSLKSEVLVGRFVLRFPSGNVTDWGPKRTGTAHQLSYLKLPWMVLTSMLIANS